MKKIKLLFIPFVIIMLIACLSACSPLIRIIESGILDNDHTNPSECEHKWEEIYVENPTCDSPGRAQYGCKLCYNTKFEELPPTGHNPISADIPVTCFENGYIGRFVCEYCKTVLNEGEFVPCHGHTNTEIRGAVEATCSSNGYSGDTYCLDCEQTVEMGYTVYATEHNYVIVEGYEKTCTANGLSDGRVCNDCGYVADEQYVIPAGHEIEIVYAVEPFCETPGHTEGQWCSLCETYLVEPEEIPALSHSEYVSREGYAATCTSEGFTDEISCSRCYKVVAEREIIPASHSEETIPAISATCSTYGYTEGVRCSACKEIITAPQIVAKLKHSNIVSVSGYAATCHTSGLTDGKECSDCGTPTVTQHIIPSQGHVFGDDGHCTGCELVVTEGLKFVTIDYGVSYYVAGFEDGYGSGVSTLVIPSTYNGKPVTGIESDAFTGYTDIKEVILPDSIISIEAGAFSGCTLDYLEIKDVDQYETLRGQNGFSGCEINEVRPSTNDGLTPYQIYLKAMSAINHNLTRYTLTSDGVTHLTYGGTKQKALSTQVIQKQYYNSFYVYQSETDYMSASTPTTTQEFYYVDNYLYIPNANGNRMAYCSPEAFSGLFMTESNELPDLTEKFFKDARFVIKADGKMYLDLVMDNELIAELILTAANISADMNVQSCTYSYAFDLNGNIISYKVLMDYTIAGMEQFLWSVDSTTTFEDVGTLPRITAPYGYTDVSTTLSNQCRYGHQIVECEEAPAGCYEYGKSAYSYCKICYTAIEEYTIIEPSHNFENGECTDCGYFESDNTSAGLAYRLNDEGTGYILVGIGDCKDTFIVVPQQVYGLPVLSVDADAFEGTDVTNVVIGTNEWYINDFHGCDDTTQYWV